MKMSVAERWSVRELANPVRQAFQPDRIARVRLESLTYSDRLNSFRSFAWIPSVQTVV